MTRDQLLARVQRDRADALRQGWLTSLIGVGLVGGAGWWIASGHPATSGAILALTAGGTVILMALARQLTPAPAYGGGRLEARMAPMGWLMSLALLAVIASAAFYALSATSAWRKGELLVALAIVLVLMLTNWGLSLGGGPVVTIDGEGYHDRRATRAPIPWDQLEAIDTRFVRSQAYYRIRPKDRARLTWLARLNILVGFDGFAINGVGLDHGEGDMLLAIQAYRPELIGDI